ncbi:TetR/AcrR family transcriptional regulator [Actinotalea sp. K2]|uniref:TetR/AcrR family transcriptional regulator n=1 Tax=Actinotalea sp. K2 TaxID=2939438 RepID=UPI002017CA7D|nr:TetR/AcrR family transcriptional regulator [Actinotalea sp. K2]MCL3860929.1 TetR/AcrR family transcriptional regulator [Actinotalea sp. K2]
MATHDPPAPVDSEPDTTAELPRELAVLWRSQAPGRRGPRPGLTLDRIADAAIALADAEGLAAVSMARVAAALGVTTMALYRYVSSKDELLAVMADVAVGWPPPPHAAGTEWRVALEGWAHAQIAALTAHPWITRATASPPLGPHSLAWLEAGLRALDDTPLDPGTRTSVVGALSLHMLSEGQVLAAIADQERAQERTGSRAPEHPALVDYATLLRLLADADDHPHVVAAVASGAFDDDPDEPYDTSIGLDLLLDGIAALIDRAAAQRPPQDGRGDA